ncbi:hypothetical protein ANANG_G00078810 [Anguilla anguilla]|uniref:SPX domain-containing protein n=1 Tax=Anguilla anguilla TaxID=7936 RepID=A0A9D3MJZ7_ANGAN|nr:hypothetical protein ANANG_G00078810 [Anguilla anguilla]
MKFAEHLSAHITPEWRKQYIQYEAFKEMLYAAQDQAPSIEGLLRRLCLRDPAAVLPASAHRSNYLKHRFRFLPRRHFLRSARRVRGPSAPEPASHWLAEKHQTQVLEPRGLVLLLSSGSDLPE